MLKLSYILFFGLLFLVGLLFSLQNLEPVVIRIYQEQLTVRMPLALALLLELLAGVILGLCVRFLFYLRLRARCRKLEAALQMAEAELEALRAAPGTLETEAVPPDLP